MLRHIKQDFGTTPDAVAMGFPGPVGADCALTQACTLWPDEDLRDFDVMQEIRTVFPRTDIHVINDVSAYGSFLLERGETDFCVLNIGSGVGSKTYANGIEINGPTARGGEIGHWRDPGVPAELRCDCGETGHIGAISSGRGVQRFAAWRARRDAEGFAHSALGRIAGAPADITTHALVTAIRGGDAFARDILYDAMAPLGRAAALLHVAIGCERFYLVGGFAEALMSDLPPALAASAAVHCWQQHFDWTSAFRVIEDEVRTSLLGLQYHARRAS